MVPKEELFPFAYFFATTRFTEIDKSCCTREVCNPSTVKLLLILVSLTFLAAGGQARQKKLDVFHHACVMLLTKSRENIYFDICIMFVFCELCTFLIVKCYTLFPLVALHVEKFRTEAEEDLLFLPRDVGDMDLARARLDRQRRGRTH